MVNKMILEKESVISGLKVHDGRVFLLIEYVNNLFFKKANINVLIIINSYL